MNKDGACPEKLGASGWRLETSDYKTDKQYAYKQLTLSTYDTPGMAPGA